VPVDIDVSPFDNSGSSKQGVSCTYKLHDGYAPIFAYAGTEGYLLDCELRPGKPHCPCGTPEFIRRSVELLDQLGLSGEGLFRLDGGNDAAENQGLALADKNRTAEHHLLRRPAGSVRRTNRIAFRETLPVVRGNPRHRLRLHIDAIIRRKTRAPRPSGGIVASRTSEKRPERDGF
jgi:hypothetical protein